MRYGSQMICPVGSLHNINNRFIAPQFKVIKHSQLYVFENQVKKCVKLQYTRLGANILQNPVMKKRKDEI